MNLKLVWKNANVNPVTTEIYRGLEPLDRDNLTDPLVILTNQETDWVDTDTIRGELYYYVFVTDNGVDRNVSANTPIRAVPRRGPGPIDLKYGDYEIGFFGTIPGNEFIMTQQLITATGLKSRAGGEPAIAAYAPTWLKYARKGKIIYVPDAVLVNTDMSFEAVYSAGLIFGVPGPGTWRPSGLAAVDQNKRITIGPDTFIVRVMKGYSDDPAAIAPAAADNQPAGVCEWGDFIYPQFRVMPPAQRTPNVVIDNNIGIGTRAVIQAICQENAGVGNCVGRGTVYSASDRTHVMYRIGRTTATNMGWLPVLELVEN